MQKKQFTLHSGITQRNTIKIEGLAKPKSDISEGEEEEEYQVWEKESSRWNVRRRRFLGGSVSPEKAGYDVIGVTMQIWQDEAETVQEENGGCCGLLLLMMQGAWHRCWTFRIMS